MVSSHPDVTNCTDVAPVTSSVVWFNLVHTTVNLIVLTKDIRLAVAIIVG